MGSYGREHFRSDGATERPRLDALSTAFDPGTQEVLATLEPIDGWTCLDVGAGPGSVTRWLAARVGPSGRVDALDLDTGRVAELQHPQVRSIQADITDPDLELDTYDLVHARFVLAHLRTREDVLRKLVGMLRPGGYLVLSDSADLGTPASRNADYRRTFLALWDVLIETIGSEISLGLRYHGLFVEAGLTDVRDTIFWPTVAAGAPINGFLEHTLAQMSELVKKHGVDEQTMAAAVEYLDSPTTSDKSIALVTTVGRRPLEERELEADATTGRTVRAAASPRPRTGAPPPTRRA